MAFRFPLVYPILDASFIPASDRAGFLHRLGSELAEAGVTLLEYRNKTGTRAELAGDAAALRLSMPAGQVKLILDDRVELVEEFGFDGVHVDDGDLAPADARRLLGPDRILGTFAGNLALIPGILSVPADYFAIGPVFKTVTKQTSLPSIGLDGVRKLRREAGDSVVLTAAAGITLQNASQVLEAGASTVAVAGAIFRAENPVAEFRRWMATLA